MKNTVLASLLMALVALTPAPGAPGSANAETISIAASDNAWVNKAAPDDDQNEAQLLEVKHNGNAANGRLTYLRFDLSPLAHLATIESASLDMHCISGAGTDTVFVCALNDLAGAGLGTTETSWSGNLTWNTQPQGIGKVPNAKTSGDLASFPMIANGGKLTSFDLTSALPGLLASDTNNQLTLILYALGTGTLIDKFASLTNTGGYAVPTLNVTGAIPEPGTLALLGMALLGLGWYVWRRRAPKIAVAAIIAFGLTAAVNAETISIVASHNAWVQGDSGDQSEAEHLSVTSNGSDGQNRFTYLRFDLSPLADLVTIESASLDMYWLSASQDNTVYVCAFNDLADGGLGNTETSWTSNQTWNTRLTGTGNLPNTKTSGPFASLPFVKGASPWLASFDLTAALPGLLESDTNNQLTLILYGNNDRTTKFASLDNTGPYPVPTLNVTGAIPEPGTLALLAMALLGLGWYAWRRRKISE